MTALACVTDNIWGIQKKIKSALSDRGNGPTRSSPDRTRVRVPPRDDGYIPAEKASKLVYKLEERAGRCEACGAFLSIGALRPNHD